ncbi:NAD-aldehyde dehydrogenase, partial [Trametes maxima]
EEFGNMRDEIPLVRTLQMGRPVSQVPGEIRGMLDHAEYMLSIAESVLADVLLPDTDKPWFRRSIKRVPFGVMLVVAPWNYPFLVMINSVLPALIAGNAAIIKPSPQTPLAAEHLVSTFHKAGVPRDVLQVIHLSPKLTTTAVKNQLVDFAVFTGSVADGRVIDVAAVEASGFKGVELGGKDPAYVRADANVDYTVAELVDGAIFNSGQSCCAVECIYVHESIFDDFVSRFVELTEKDRLGDPTQPETNIGPVVSLASVERIRKQVAASVGAGAKLLIPKSSLPLPNRNGTLYVAPQVLVDVNHSAYLHEVTFGPVVGIQKVAFGEEAIALTNDSPYGLTASVWTNPESEVAILQLVDKLHTGMVFLNRCDYLDPALVWTGVKNSGLTVSALVGYDHLTKAKSVQMKIENSQ